MKFIFVLLSSIFLYISIHATTTACTTAVIIRETLGMERRSSQQSQGSRSQSQSKSSRTESLETAHCPRCNSTNSKKRSITCNICSSQWHLTCVRLKRVQAEALGSWSCPNCTNGSKQLGKNQQDSSQSLGNVLPHEYDNDLADSLAKLKQKRRVVQRIPKGCRITTADALTTLIETAVEDRTEKAMTKLFQFPCLALAVPDKDTNETNSNSLTSKIKRQVVRYMESDLPDITSLHGHQNKRQARSSARPGSDYLKRAVSLKLSDGDVRGAIRLLASNDQIAEHSEEVVESLKQKHPPAPADLRLPPAPEEDCQPYMSTEQDIISAIASFDTGSSAGLDGLRPAHLKDLTSRSAGEAGPRLIKALTSLVNLALRGEIPSSARAAFYGASLTALRKKDGGIRPIAVGSTYRRLATKVGLKPLSTQLGQELRPTQLGYGTPGGCEAAVHASRQFTAHLQTDSVVVKLDMRNAFNTVRRDHFLRITRELAAPLYPLLWQAYSQPTPLYYGIEQILSATGVQQGDPCGPAVFALAINPIASAVSCDFNCWYLDDGTVGGETASVCENLQRLLPAMAEIGLEVNPRKCEIILPDSTTTEVKDSTVSLVRQVIPEAAVLTDRELTILGAPISQAAAEVTMNDKKGELERMVERLQDLDSHTAFFLLKNSLWLPKLQYLLRAAPIYQQPELLQAVDRILKAAVSLISNVDFNEESWRQAVLPTRYGGLGLRRTEDVALPSYVASVKSCLALVTVMVPEELRASVAHAYTAAAEDWRTLAGASEPPEADLRAKQRAWDDILTKRQWETALSEANQFARARLLSAATPGSGAWLHAIPAASLGTMLDKETLRVAISLRIGADVCIPHKCRCGSSADSKGYHALTCRVSAGRHPRHTALNDVIRRALQSAGIPSILEPAGLDRGDGKRPDGMTVFPYSQGKSLVWDATCVNTYAETNIALSATSSGGAAKEAEGRKRRKYAGLQQQFQFEPVAFETAGACGPTTRTFIKELGARLAGSSGDRREAAWLWQRLSIAVIRGNAVSVLSTTKPKSVMISQQQHLQQQLPPPAQHQQREQQQETRRVSELPPPRQQHQIHEKQRMCQHVEGSVSTEFPPKLTQEKQDVARELLPKVKGLINLGNSCYLNSVLQCLSQCHYLTHYLDISSRPGSKVTIAADGEKMELVLPEAGPITASLYDFMKQMHTSGTTANVSPSYLLSKLPQFKGCQQQDAHELLRVLLEQARLEDLRRHQMQIMLRLGLPTSTDPEQAPGDVKVRVKTLCRQVSHTTIDSIFCGQLVSLVVCLACMTCTHRMEAFLDLSLPVTEDKLTDGGAEADDGPVANGDPVSATSVASEDGSLSLTQSEWLRQALTTLAPRQQAASGECSLLTCLNQYTAPELLVDSNKLGCDICTEKRNKQLPPSAKGGKKGTVYSDASKQLLIYSPPPVLTIHLKRFDVSNCRPRKINRHTQFGELLDLAPFCSSISQDLPQMQRGQRRVLYSLLGLVEHSGRLTSGHYTAYVCVRRRHNSLTVNPAMLSPLVTDAYRLACERARQRGEENPERCQISQAQHVEGVQLSQHTEQTEERVQLLQHLEKETSERVCSEAHEQELPNSEPERAEPETGRWFHVSDSHVTEVTLDTVLKAQAYILFYERIV